MLDMVLPKVERAASSENYAKFSIEPLEPGFGVTLGNALRRVLLSSLPGAAVTSIRIDGTYHEFSAIDHVREDTTDLILNVKQIRLRSFTDRPVLLRLEASGVGEVKAADIICPPEVEIVNPELHLATLESPEARLSVEMTVERGKGYKEAETREDEPIGVIPVDAIYTPIRKVNFTVENTRIGQVTNYDRLLLEVWTDGTITPDDAISQSAQVLMRHLSILSDLSVKPTPRLEKQPAAATIPAKLYDTPIEDLDLSVRAYNCLKRAGITKVGQVLEMSEDDLLGVRNFGKKSLEELRERLAARGFIESSRLAPPGEAGFGEELEEAGERGEAEEGESLESEEEEEEGFEDFEDEEEYDQYDEEEDE